MKILDEKLTSSEDWNNYTAIDHQTWSQLLQRQNAILEKRAHPSYLQGLKLLSITKDLIPKHEEINETLKPITDWTIVPVSKLISEEFFFALLAKRQFPITTFIRKPEQLDYIEEPDVMHDLFGHIPLLTNPIMADFIQKFGEIGTQAIKKGFGEEMRRLYWFTVEFGLIKENHELKIYGAGILSSKSEAIYSLESNLPNRLKFDPLRVMRTQFQIDDLQKTYFVIDDFNHLYKSLDEDWESRCKNARHLGNIEDGLLLESEKHLIKNKERLCSMDLKNKTCVACHAGMPQLKPEEIQNHLKSLAKNWQLNDRGHLEKTFLLKDFQQAMDLAIKISVVAENKGHHPDLYIAWGKCIVEIWTHKVNGLTDSDFILAAAIEGVAS